MEKLAKNGSAVFVYGPGSYLGIAGKDYLRRKSARRSLARNDPAFQPIGDLLIVFLSCRYGLLAMHWEGSLLYLPNGSAIDMEQGTRFKIEAKELPE